MSLSTFAGHSTGGSVFRRTLRVKRISGARSERKQWLDFLAEKIARRGHHSYREDGVEPLEKRERMRGLPWQA